jgi:hypothetical protein
MINTYDAQEIATAIADIYRTKLAQRRVDVTGDELDAVRNFVYSQLSNKVDNSMIQSTQYDPRLNKVVDHVKN